MRDEAGYDTLLTRGSTASQLPGGESDHGTPVGALHLDAPDFRYDLSGRLGTMPAKAFNRFLSVNEGFECDGGGVEGIDVRQTMRAGRTRTTVTPRYRDLSVDPTGEGGGVIGSVTRGAKEFLAQSLLASPGRCAGTTRQSLACGFSGSACGKD